MSDNKKYTTEDCPELCINAQTVNDDMDFYCHLYKQYNSCKFPVCKHYDNGEKELNK